MNKKAGNSVVYCGFIKYYAILAQPNTIASIRVKSFNREMILHVCLSLRRNITEQISDIPKTILRPLNQNCLQFDGH